MAEKHNSNHRNFANDARAFVRRRPQGRLALTQDRSGACRALPIPHRHQENDNGPFHHPDQNA